MNRSTATLPADEVNELFVVEGVSAANAVENVCDRSFQRVVAVQGKPLNAVRAGAKAVATNDRAIELAKHLHPADDPNRWGRVILLTDGDVDGVHAKALLLALIGHIASDLIDGERLFTVRAPLFGLRGTGMDAPKFAYTPDGRDDLRTKMAEAGIKQIKSKHYKGLASMNRDDLWCACVNPATRPITALGRRHLEVARSALA